MAAVDANGLVLVPLRQQAPVRPGDRVTAVPHGDAVRVGRASPAARSTRSASPSTTGARSARFSPAPLGGSIPRPLDASPRTARSRPEYARSTAC
ncbi:MAG: hypothetical protein WDN24_15210 [Sphingomonas sp.]